jgi:subtilase family serine protease
MPAQDTHIHSDDIPWYPAATPIGQSPTCLTHMITIHCYSPQQIWQAYNILPLFNMRITGIGQTIVIIDPYQNPTIRTDLAIFDQLFGLPEPVFNIFTPFGTNTITLANEQRRNVASEISLDVEWAHAIAPAATIDLVLSPTNTDEDIYRTTRFAIEENLGAIISQSFGGSETCLTSSYIAAEHALFAEAQARQISVLASAGDMGSLSPICSGNQNKFLIGLGPGVDYPASDPLVISVGGTRLLTYPTGTYRHETVWNDSREQLGSGATGGGFSQIFAQPAYQNWITPTIHSRGLPDIAFNADPITGVATVVHLSKKTTVLLPIGGTSVGAPVWGGIIALANQFMHRRSGFLNPALYNQGRSTHDKHTFHDIVTGNNAYTLNIGDQVFTIPGYNAHPGWDPTTGLGTPDVASLMTYLATSSNTLPLHPTKTPTLPPSYHGHRIMTANSPYRFRVKKQQSHQPVSDHNHHKCIMNEHKKKRHYHSHIRTTTRERHQRVHRHHTTTRQRQPRCARNHAP